MRPQRRPLYGRAPPGPGGSMALGGLNGVGLVPAPLLDFVFGAGLEAHEAGRLAARRALLLPLGEEAMTTLTGFEFRDVLAAASGHPNRPFSDRGSSTTQCGLRTVPRES